MMCVNSVHCTWRRFKQRSFTFATTLINCYDLGDLYLWRTAGFGCGHLEFGLDLGTSSCNWVGASCSLVSLVWIWERLLVIG